MEKRAIRSHELFIKWQDDKAPCVILFHGYGASADNLFDLIPYLDPSESWNFIFPQAPVSNKYEGFPIRSWFDIDIEKLIAYNQAKDLESFIHEVPAGMALLHETINAWISELKLCPEQLVLGGFSQGAVCALDFALKAAKKLKGLLLFSSTIFNLPVWKELLAKGPSQNYFLSHGDKDDILDYQGALMLQHLLDQAKWKGTLHSFKGGHEIPLITLSKAREYLTHLKQSCKI